MNSSVATEKRMKEQIYIFIFLEYFSYNMDKDVYKTNEEFGYFYIIDNLMQKFSSI